MNLLEQLKVARFIVIARHVPVKCILPCAEALIRAGVEFLEITFDPSQADTQYDTAKKVSLLKKHFPDLRIGCGTVITTEMVHAAADSGAEYIVSPNTSPLIISETKKYHLLSIPGVYTPTEIVQAYNLGADIVKIFPVMPGHEAYVKNVMTPLSHIPFMITGGITPETIHVMLATGALAVASGASVIKQEWLSMHNYQQITLAAKRHLEAM